MSRSNNTDLINPAQRYYEWVGSKGCLKYFDKNKGENGEQVLVNLPFTFLVLDRLSSIKGFSDADQSGFWSNEVRDIKRDTLNVRTKKGLVASGTYSSLVPILNQGACYNQSVYIAIKENNDFIIANLAIHGSAIGEWINICKGKDIYKYAITIASATPMKKGATNYFVPVFKLNPKITEETEKKCIELDKQLQEYLKAYFNKNKTQEQESISAKDIITDRQKQDIGSLKKAELIEVVEAEPVDTFIEISDDLPF